MTNSSRNLIVLSDGTGNSASKPSKTNVWRLYQAIDLTDGSQVAVFGDGVGTTSVKILRVLGLALGVGVKRNVLNLYKFLCRNYNADDRIWAFGFSRGAFTVRVLVGLIYHEGLVSFESEAELKRNALAAYRSYRQKAFPTVIPWVLAGRYLRDLLVSIWNAMTGVRSYDIDGLMHNNVVKSDIHSVDMHGFSEAIFGATHLLGFYFAPRLKRLGHQQLYAFERRKVYQDQGFRILPHKYVSLEVIKEQWDDILRLMATIKLKLTPASQIFKRLNSYSKQHRLYQALKAFGQIIKTLFILTYLDDVLLRQAIEKQLNKVEHAQRFAKAVYHGGNQEFLQATKEEQEKAEACKRLIQNAIILWNYLYLSKKVMEEKDRAGQRELLKTIQSGSIVAWSHVHLQGEYDFSAEKMRDSVGFNFSQILAFKLEENWEV